VPSIDTKAHTCGVVQESNIDAFDNIQPLLSDIARHIAIDQSTCI